MKICKRFIITGRVQGVWFRRETKRKADVLKITGYAKNLGAEEVEVVACGKIEDLKELEAWLWQGPLLARVDNIAIETIDDQIFYDFETL